LSTEQQIERIKARLKQRAGCNEDDMRVVYSPLRISPLGAHVDHQDGLVTGMTLNRALLLAFVPRDDRRVCVESLNFPSMAEFDLDDVPPKVPSDWGNYARGAVLALQQEHVLHCGIDAVVEGKMPIGGLSSSAAVGVAYLLALEAANSLAVTPMENIQLDRYVENVYLGLKNGILDQSIILLSDRAHLTYLDCQSVQFEKFQTPLTDQDVEILVVYSGLARPLTGTDYNNRVYECQQAARTMLEWAGRPVPETPCLRLVSEETYADLGDRLPPPLDRRARHFFTEIDRVRKGIAAWRAGDLAVLGCLIDESGASSIYNYECGSPHLITLYQILRQCPGVYGARFSGGGFRGSCIGLTDPACREEIKATIDAQYPLAHPDVVDSYSVHFCQPDGAARLWDRQ
jgi:galactokinase/galacturonokinase